ncbi:MAG: DUF2306 domain-containing protein [Alphaproteobacteria bacterium]|nr:MAG: DUF2306 domain-containing protein [Alphaproteobacteria bacterium]
MKKILYLAMLLSATGVAIVSWRFFFGADPGQLVGQHFANNPLGAYLHFLFSPLALLIGGLQFAPRLRARRPLLHRGVGWLYVFSCILGGVGSLLLVANSPSPALALIGFLCLGALWIITPVMALVGIAARDIARHQAWMTRSYALTFAAVTLRLYLPLFFALAGERSHELFDTAYTIIAWACWLPNLLLAEWLLVRPLMRRRLAIAAPV